MNNFNIDKECFRKEFFEKNLLHMKSCLDPARYDWEDFGNDFFSIEPGLGTVRLYRDGRVDRQVYQHAAQNNEEVGFKFDEASFANILNNGGSMVVNRFEKSSRYVAALCRELSDYSGHATVGNAYATKGGTGTFGKHWDSHCVFAVQLIGKKHWTVFRPTVDLPLSTQNGFAKAPPTDTEMVFDGILEAGDVLYIPRGWWHAVNPLADQPSLHIAVGIHTPKVLDYLKWVLIHKMSANKEFRETMALTRLDAGSMAQACELLTSSSTSSETFEEYLNALNISLSEKPYIDFDSIFK
ncbi:JmjC domain-containing protein [Pseudoduganella buxea]|uniref:JmjC domain-containing protein n=1 Tax=Pseudoduganella buxea TaxID=1949069 RepID=A0A6I3SZW0_9BURK|nr:cupin domain-containing protein [Pseudoduganella buxea]MTV54116.1 hypothetical protein [Pseudoduganella buxea]GGC14285.1 hypothetical protein GCM10011572_39680 [Pseudoduganella buxea]